MSDEPRVPNELRVAIEGREPAVIVPEGHGLTFTATPEGRIEVAVGDKLLCVREQAFTCVVGSGQASSRTLEPAVIAAVTERERLVAAFGHLQGEHAKELRGVIQARDEAELRALEAEALAASLSEANDVLERRCAAFEADELARPSVPPPAPEPT